MDLTAKHGKGKDTLQDGTTVTAKVPPEFVRMYKLSDREKQVIQGAMNGLSIKECADHMHLSRKTVEQYWQRIFTKTGCRSRERVMASLIATLTHSGFKGRHSAR